PCQACERLVEPQMTAARAHFEQARTRGGNRAPTLLRRARAAKHPGTLGKAVSVETKGRRHLKTRVDEHAHGSVYHSRAATGGELGVIGKRRTRADHDRVRTAAQRVDQRPRPLAGDPARLPTPGRDTAIEGRGDFERHEGTATLVNGQEASMLFSAGLLENTGAQLEPGRSQRPRA